MRWLIWWLRSWFCKHKWELEEVKYMEYGEYLGETFVNKEGTKVSATCKECGWHRSYWKW
jgi:RNase P subunit RPR2